MNRYSLYKIADLDFYVETGLLEDVDFANFLPFKEDFREDVSPIFKLTTGKIPAPQGDVSSEQRMDTGIFRAWIEEDKNIIEFISADGQGLYRLVSDKFWKEIVLDVGEVRSLNRVIAINGLLLIAFTYSAAFHDAVMLHASTVKREDWAVAFIGPSGAGKSTHSRLWLEHISGTSLLNDDQPVVRIVDGKPYLFGSPWSGKTPCYKNEKARMVAAFRMIQAEQNRLEAMRSTALFSSLLSACAAIKEDVITYRPITQTVANLCGLIIGYTLNSRPEKEAALLTFGATKE